MDLESELRKAMAEHTAETAAPPSLVRDVRRRHRRRVQRNRAALGIAAVTVLAVAAVPSYRSFQADPVSTTLGPTAPTTQTTRPSGQAPIPSAPGPTRSPHSTAGPGAGPSQRSTGPGAPGEPGLPLPTGRLPKLPAWITYLPAGLAAVGPCATHRTASDTTTICTWRGPSGSVEARLVRGTGFGGPEGLGAFPAVPTPADVRGRRAIMTDRPDTTRQIAWLDRPGVGVLLIVGGAVRDRLLQIAEGIRP